MWEFQDRIKLDNFLKKKEKLACLWELLRGEEPGQNETKISGQLGGMSVDFPESIPDVALFAGGWPKCALAFWEEVSRTSWASTEVHRLKGDKEY